MGNCIHNKKIILDVSDRLEIIYGACPCELLHLLTFKTPTCELNIKD